MEVIKAWLMAYPAEIALLGIPVFLAVCATISCALAARRRRKKQANPFTMTDWEYVRYNRERCDGK